MTAASLGKAALSLLATVVLPEPVPPAIPTKKGRIWPFSLRVGAFSCQESPRNASKGGMQRPLILLANDDGYRAQGLRALADALRKFADVVVCAPETEQSTTSHSLTLTRPLRLRGVTEG